MSKIVVVKCEVVDCKKDASFCCPVCLKLGISGSVYCSQPCFQNNWKNHKKIHSLFGMLLIHKISEMLLFLAIAHLLE